MKIVQNVKDSYASLLNALHILPVYTIPIVGCTFSGHYTNTPSLISLLLAISLSLSLILSLPKRQFIYQMCEELLQLCKGLIVSSSESAHKMLKLVTQLRE